MLFFLYAFFRLRSADEFIDGFVELFNGVEVIVLDGIDYACRHMLLEDDPAY